MGHKSNECPQRRVLHIQVTIGDSKEETEDFVEIDNEETELVGGDEGDPLLCIIQKVSLSFKVPEYTQRNSIFKTKCTIKGKLKKFSFLNPLSKFYTLTLINILTLTRLDGLRRGLKLL